MTTYAVRVKLAWIIEIMHKMRFFNGAWPYLDGINVNEWVDRMVLYKSYLEDENERFGYEG